jgi:hypothetical protein
MGNILAVRRVKDSGQNHLHPQWSLATKQKEEILRKFAADWRKIVHTLEWLKEDNVLCENVHR